MLGVGCRPKLPCSVPAEAEVKLSVRAFPELGPQEDSLPGLLRCTRHLRKQTALSERGPWRGAGSLRTGTQCCLEKT